MKTKTKKTKPKYTFEVYRGKVKFQEGRIWVGPLWYWRCRHSNGDIEAEGTKGYSSKALLARSIELWLTWVMAKGTLDLNVLPCKP